MRNSLYKKNIISISDLNQNELELVLKKSAFLKVKAQPNLLKNKIIASCFFEASTRTRLSFETAVHRLGASIIGFSDGSNISLGKKGETLSDTISVISSYVDAIIIRHPQEGSARLAAQFSNGVPIFNAGDGANQHPTQTLLDLFTIKETQNKLNNLNIAMVGDLKYGRTVHSLTQALAKYKNNQFFFVSPDSLTMPNYINDMLYKKEIHWKRYKNIEEIISEIDILYMTRVQKERLDSTEYASAKSKFVLQTSTLKNARNNLKILHPLPRIDEIDNNVDFTPYAWYFKQAANGIYARQAILSLVLIEKHFE
ncbi:aspartate carbamoyltransferase [Buchnera aphidicola]|uniref:Aspartate carbamoyltransferase catalytic subunit n=1 Tax=Buchnera aphidicola subsp. Schizaphis graminum (strain Sg) TaxID=198804 RepID=PYRB_BUCAP|nr:aspartate carbamoyltransferase [Buchnera aphidicola]Q8K9H9.1 RecName: Full=Aspartate carbamoyltransferase catalytic subunit; AltName: Full=Aspartate transcarbamylase; Short=ATCase [Buchnera aphidicola str. Sg (Schizaphis graminum)]AAM67910.1 aspartate carbamoyltransferase catalytic chain [Buchnera aphidicola str. Sg (Schizaphis graminum)]AWI49596.1 aspartate carbamoyltransferase [Buchnera aphidicola (Schizaphis graminum)]